MSTFDSTRVNADFTLSNGNLTATHSGVTAEDDIAPGNGYHASGKWTFTMTFGVVTGSHTQFGMCGSNTSVIIGQHIGQDTTSCGVGAGTGQMFNLNGNVSIGALAFTSNAVMDMAVDLTAMLAWLRWNGGSWNGSLTAFPGVSGGVVIGATPANNAFTPAANVYTLNDSVVLSTTKNLGIPGFLPWDSLSTQTDGAVFANLTGASGVFVLAGGAYSFDAVVSAGGGTIALQQLGPDGVTWVNSFSPLSASGVQSPLFLPPGTYRFNGGTGNYSAAIQRVKFA